LKARSTVYLDSASLALANMMIEEGETTSAFLQRMIREAGEARGFEIKVEVKAGIWKDGKLIKEM
jgi:hypothetical protein